MEINKHLDIAPEVLEALEVGAPVVALESTILSHGMPFPQNVAFAKGVERIARDKGVVPATTAIVNGRLKVGLTEAERDRICDPTDVGKVSRRDVAVYVAEGLTGATTVASTMILASMAGIRFFATGGLGGVHRGAEKTFDISADLQELANTPVAVICAGAKSLLDLKLTLEYLETMGVPVLGYQTEYLPAFYCKSSGLRLDRRCESAAEIAGIARAKWELGLKGGMIIGNPIPDKYALDYDEMEGVIGKALDMAKQAGIHGKDTTPYLLKTIKDLTGGESFESNVELAYNNVRLACDIALEYSNQTGKEQA
ncbi:MAG: pseudouridine-5'-phosphate glycosidase [Oscillospiraceae bacterium]|nr:pseudouridine-5'-phosphate glycosidase [Oscillospiraceae bacterium]